MTLQAGLVRGGCLCGALRYEAYGNPAYMGHCYCADCRKASGGGFIPFMSFSSSVVSFQGESRAFVSRSARGTDAERNFCPSCGSLVFGGVRGVSDSYTVYAGSLDDPNRFKPSMAIFTRDRPAWAMIPKGLQVFEGLPD